MKKIYFVLALLVPISCTDLDLKPADGDVDEVIFTTLGAYTSYLAKVYAAFSLTGQQGPNGQPDISIVNDEGFTSYIRVYWKAQELTTDEAVIAWTDAGIRDLHELSWSSENQFMRVLYYRIFYIIAYANDFIGQSEPSKMDSRGISPADQAIIARYRAEARFLRALAYWHALDLFRNVPILQTITTELPVQATPTELFNFIESELTAIEPEMAEPMLNDYGRADKAALWTLQAKLFLNAQVHTGQDRFTDCAAACQKVIDAGYTLAPKYVDLFLADNDKERTTELIFTLPSDGVNSQSWGSTTFLVHGALGGRMADKKKDSDNTTEYLKEDVDLYGVSGGWAGMRTTTAMVSKFSGATIPVGRDPRAILYTNGQTPDIIDIGKFTQGYAVPKFKNIKSTSTPSVPVVGSNPTHCDTDYPLFRLADVYLMYAEAVERGGTGDAVAALGYINALRQRAYGDNSADIIDTQLTLDFILDERVRELYWEGTRRIDLIRFDKFKTGVWPWKGGVDDGTYTADDHLLIFPIPASDLAANPLLVQNPEY